MKKYWQLLVVVVVIIATISIHYIQVASASSQTYKLTFEKISGDDKYLDSLKIEGSIGVGYTSNPVILTKDEVKIESRFLYDYSLLTMKALIDNHKDFMRGKMRSPVNFYEDDAQLIYVKDPEEPWKLNEGDTFSYDIDVLNKDENKTDSFSVNLKLNSPVSWISVNNIVLVNNELKFITSLSRNDGDNELHLVTIDLKDQQLLSDTILDIGESNENVRTDFQSYDNYQNLGPEKYYVYSMNTQSETPPYNIIREHFKVVNFETNEITPLEIPESVVSRINMGVVDNNYFVVSSIEEGDLVLHRYNIGQKRWLEPVPVKEPVKVLNTDSYTMQATNGKIYLFNDTEQGFYLRISDIEKGETLYEGILKRKDAKQKFSLWVEKFHEMNE